MSVVVAIGCGTTHVNTSARVAEQERGSTEAFLQRLRPRPAWLFPFTQCPADVFPGANTPVNYGGYACASHLDACLEQCRSNDASACYLAALRAQEVKAPMDYSEALFLKACSLGVASGCTNRAAGMIVNESNTSNLWACANRTFEAMCNQDDPWACTMWGHSLLLGRSVQRDVARAREVLPKGCLLGEDDPACEAARKLLKETDATSN